MDKKLLVGTVLIIGLLSGLLPAIVFGTTSFPTYQTSNDADAWEDYDWYESNQIDNQTLPFYASETWNNRTTEGANWDSTHSKFRYEIPTALQDGDLFTKVYIDADSVSITGVSYLAFIDADENVLFNDTSVSTTINSGDYNTVDFDDWCGVVKWFEIPVTAHGVGYKSGTNEYEDKYWDGDSWEDMDDLEVCFETYTTYGYSEDFAYSGEWTGGSTDGDVLTYQYTGGSWLTGYGYRKSHVLSQVTAAGDRTGFQIMLDVNYGSGTDSGNSIYLDSKCQTDFDDVRFTDDDKVTELDYWLEEKTDSDDATFWVKIDDDLGAGDVTFYIYYGNTGASSTSDGPATFNVFLDNSNTSGWTTSDMSVSASGDFLRFYHNVVGSKATAYRTDFTTPADFVIEYQAKMEDAPAGADKVVVTEIDGSSSDAFGYLIHPPSGDQSDVNYWDGASKVLSNGGLAFSTEYIFKTVVDEGDSSFGLDYYFMTTDRSVTDSVVSENFALGSPSDCDGLHIEDGTNGAIDLYIRWLFIRKIPSDIQEVSHSTWGSEEFNGFYNTTSVNIASSTYQFIEFVITDTNTTITIKVTVSSTYYTVDSSLGAGTHRYNLEEVVSGTIDGIYVCLDSTGTGDYTKLDHIRIYRFFEWTSVATDGDKTEYAYLDSGDLITNIDSGKHLNLTYNVDDFSTDDLPYCRLEVSTGTVGLTLLDSGDAELETKNFTTSTNTQQFSFSLAVDEIRLQIYDDMTIDFITFSVMSVTISGITSNLEDTWASPDQTITISSVTGSWGDGNSISASNLWVDFKENSTYLETNVTTIAGRTVQLYNSTYEIGVSHTNDSRYRYFTSGTNYTFWIIGTQVTGSFYYDVQRIADVNYIITFYQTGQFSWLNGSIISTQPDVYSYLNSTENGYRVLGDDAWLPDGVYPVSITSTQGEYETTFKFNLTTGDFWEEFYSCVITPMDEVESHLVFSFYSNLDSLGLPDKLLKIYVDETRVHHMEHWIAGNTINLTITDYHNHEVEWEATGMSYPWYEFTAADIVFIDLGLDFYPLQFYNPGDYPLIVEITSNSESMNYTAHPYQSTPEHRTAAGAYTVKTWWYEYNEGEEAYTKIDEWEVTARPVTVTSESYNFQLKGVYKDEPVPKGEPTPDYVKPPEFWFGIGAVGCIIFLVGVAVVLSRREGGLVATPPPEEAEEPRKRLVNPGILKKIKLIDPKLYKEITEIEREIDRTEKTRKGGRR